MEHEIFIISGLTIGQKARYARISKGLRQIDLAVSAKVAVNEVTNLEKDRFVCKSRKKLILQALGLFEEQPEAQHGN